jgi:MYXO-CTERM domain-containing protein
VPMLLAALLLALIALRRDSRKASA